MPDAGEEHRQIETIGGGDNLQVADGSPRLDNRRRTRLSGFFDVIGKREEGVGCDNTSLQIVMKFSGLSCAKAD